MASEGSESTLGLDDVMSTLMSMGFEFDDCQEAITNGKLTVQAAIDWILAGKPCNVVAAQPSLKLAKPKPSGNTSNPFVPANVSYLKGSSAESSLSGNALDVDMEDDTIVSRSHLSEKQQQIKLSFEEKERQEARRVAQDEKKKKRLERERILKEIQEDRERLKLTKQGTSPSASTHDRGKGEQTGQLSTDGPSISGSMDTSINKTSIQVRLPSGQMFRQSFPVQATLNSVWDAVYAVIKTAVNAHSGFIQPFPRREFSKEEMGHTLQVLGLVPSGSLVLKKKDADQAAAASTPSQPPAVMRALEEGVMEEDENRGRPPRHLNPSGQPPPPFEVGRGMNRGPGPGPEPMEEDDDSDDNMGLGANPLDQFLGLAQHPILGNQPVFEGFGQRLVPEGVPGDNNRHLSRSAAEMAAEAAAHRSAQAPQVPTVSEARPATSSLVYQVTSLQDLAMHTLAHRLIDPRKPIFSVSGLPEELLQKFLSYLMKERLLKPKVLHLMPSYLLKLVLDYYPYATNELLYSARVFVHLHTLSLNSCTLITDAGLNPIKALKALKVLNLNGCSQITNHSFSVITELHNLQALHLEGTGVTDQGIIQFTSSDSCPQLQHLDLSRTNVTHEIFLHLPNQKKLRSLFMKSSKIGSLAGIDGVTTLENLDISDTVIVTDSVLCLTRLPNLHQISLSGTSDVHGDTALYYLKEMKLTALILPSRSTTSDVGMAYISGFPLTALDLTNYTSVGDAGMVHIGKIVTLKRLLLGNTKISDEGMQQLTGLVNLQVLFLDRTLITNAGVAAVKNFKLLNELSLSATSITNDLLKQGHLNSCFNLTRLNMSRTIIGDKGISSLILPNLQLLNLDCTRVHPLSVSVIEKNCPNVRNVTIANLSSLAEADEN